MDFDLSNLERARCWNKNKTFFTWQFGKIITLTLQYAPHPYSQTQPACWLPWFYLDWNESWLFVFLGKLFPLSLSPCAAPPWSYKTSGKSVEKAWKTLITFSADTFNFWTTKPPDAREASTNRGSGCQTHSNSVFLSRALHHRSPLLPRDAMSALLPNLDEEMDVQIWRRAAKKVATTAICSRSEAVFIATDSKVEISGRIQPANYAFIHVSQ